MITSTITLSLKPQTVGQNQVIKQYFLSKETHLMFHASIFFKSPKCLISMIAYPFVVVLFPPDSEYDQRHQALSIPWMIYWKLNYVQKGEASLHVQTAFNLSSI